jgi:hypothetical protein
MLNPITFSIEHDGKQIEVTANGLDYAAYEDEFDKPTVAGISEGRYKTFMFLVWHAMKRQDLISKPFDEFLADSPMFGSPERIKDVPPLGEPQAPGQ